MASVGSSCALDKVRVGEATERSAPACTPHPARALIDLSANENPLGPSPYALAAITKAARQMHRYPEKEGTALKEALSERLGVEREQLLLGNGSAELIDGISRATLWPGDEAILGAPSFPAYRSCIARADGTAVAIPLRDGAEDLPRMARRICERTRLIILANPNNPAGGAFDAAQWEEFLAQLPSHVMVVADEAYFEYVSLPEYPQTLKAVAEGRNVIVLRSFSKAYGLAGLRIGYGVAPAPLRQRIEAQLQHYNTNRMAQVAALAALGDRDHLARCVAMNAQGRLYLQRELSAMGFSVAPSQANFLLVRVADAARVHEQLRRQGVLVKRLDAFGQPDAIRVSVGRPEENKRFLEALANATTPQSRGVDAR
jgi:histidinol-phosphate aminotransferase